MLPIIVIFLITLSGTLFSFENINGVIANCATYNPMTQIISVSCKSTTLTDLYNTLSNHKILNKESPGVWILNANLVIADHSKLSITPQDTKWLKINSTNGIPHFIQAKGSMVIDSVKITSWDTNTNNYAITDSNGTIPRSSIMIFGGTAATNITNSEIAYLGYNGTHSYGLAYYQGSGSIIKNNNLHDNQYGIYLQNVSGIRVEGNQVHNNLRYGIDPYKGTHDIIIQNNTVYNNQNHGIICVDCYNVLIEFNKSYNNIGHGIILYSNVSNSTVQNNILFNNHNDQIALVDSSNNRINGNNLKNQQVGIRVDPGSNENKINDNTITNSSTYAIYLYGGASKNNVSSNAISNSLISGIYVVGKGSLDNTFQNNKISDNKQTGIKLQNNTSMFIGNTVGNTTSSHYELGGNSTLKIKDTPFPSTIIKSKGNNLLEITYSKPTHIIIVSNKQKNLINSVAPAISFPLQRSMIVTIKNG
ncbi:MAG: right-handed parallel beta-helix repeat-containing protein [Candidatus Nitrosocosmicus sp.]